MERGDGGSHFPLSLRLSPSPTDLPADEYLDGVGEHDDTGIEEPGNVGRLVVHTVVVEEVTWVGGWGRGGWGEGGEREGERGRENT